MKKLFYMTYYTRLVVLLFIDAIRSALNSIGAYPVDFPTPVPTIAAVTSALDELAALVETAKTGGYAARLARDAQRVVVMNLWRQMALYLEMRCDGDRVMGAKTGIPLVKEKGPTPPITSVGAPVISYGVSSGDLIATIKDVKHSLMYNYRITTNPDLPMEQWETFLWEKVKFTFTNRVPGTVYYICVQAIGKDGQSVCSTHVSKMAV
jgi:hypothetical protein